MGHCLSKKPSNDGDDSDLKVEFTGGNVHLITTKDSWEQKLQEAKRDGKINVIEISKSAFNIRKEKLACLSALLEGSSGLDNRLVLRVIANFSASWCGPCRMIAPFYVELSEKHSSIMFLTVDVDELTEFSTSWDIKATPTFFFLKDGQQIDKLVGANKPELQKKMTAILDSEAPSQA